MKRTFLLLTILMIAAGSNFAAAQGCQPLDVLEYECNNFSAVTTTWCTDPEHGDDVVSVFREGTNCDETPFILVFQDEFNGTTLDQSKWRASQEGPVGSLFVHQPANVHVSGGHLWLYSQHDPGIHEYYNWSSNPPLVSGYFDFTTSEIRSRYKFHEGMYEIKCRIPSDIDACGGTWPAFWMYGQDGCNATEVDVFEYRGNDGNRWNMTTHFNVPQGCGHRECGKCYEGGYPDEDRVYRLTWDRHNIYWWRDDVGLKRNLPRWRVLQTSQVVGCNTNAGYYQMNRSYPRARPLTTHALEIIAGVGLDDRPEVEHEPDAFPTAMVVDYIRYYRRVPCIGDVTLGSTEGLLSSFGEYNFVTGTTISLENSFVLNSGQQLEIVARDHLDLDAGTVISSDSHFIARIGASNCGTPSGLDGGESTLVLQHAESDDELVAQSQLAETDRNWSSDLQPIPNSGTLLVQDYNRGKRLNWSQATNSPNRAKHLAVFSSTGAVVVDIPLSSNVVEYEIDGGQFQPGVYLVRIQTNQGVLATKFVIENE